MFTFTLNVLLIFMLQSDDPVMKAAGEAALASGWELGVCQQFVNGSHQVVSMSSCAGESIPTYDLATHTLTFTPGK